MVGPSRGATELVLGIDVGSVSVALAVVDGAGRLARSFYAFHHGRIRQTIEVGVAKLGLPDRIGVRATSSTPSFIHAPARTDGRVALIAAARALHPEARSLLFVGGERFGLIRFNEDGSYRDLRSSSSCAAGSGSFLDQQAARLGLPGPETLAELALSSGGPAPAIASRCAVFAKSDIIHAQSEGYSLPEICDGLCLGLARNIHDVVVGGAEVPGPVVFAGGVALNRAVATRLGELCGLPFLVDDCAHLYGALGASLAELYGEIGGLILASDPLSRAAPSAAQPAHGRVMDLRDLLADETARHQWSGEIIHIDSARKPQAGDTEHLLHCASEIAPDIPVEVDIYERTDPGATMKGILGIDIGSTSTKAALIDAEGRMMIGLYTRTAGQPLRAVRCLFHALQTVSLERSFAVQLAGVGTTGAGRKFVGKVVGADLVLDEISAHARAAYALDPQVDTIIEIGGQDAKFTLMRDGLVTFSQMNTVCAAGTGSFLEEQAAKLGAPLEAYDALTDGVRAPLTSDRCTVFMERDLSRCMHAGSSIPEMLAAAVVGVRENYLLKVATEGSIGSHICFQGATAKNRALVAAFEARLGKTLFVSPYCHLTGALGVALSLRDAPVESSHFRGLDLWREKLPVEIEGCTLCTNRCRIRVATVGGERVGFGFACGREYKDRRFVRQPGSVDLIAERQKIVDHVTGAAGGLPVGSDSRARPRLPIDENPSVWPGRSIGIPAALMMEEEIPFWRRFFAELGVSATASAAGDDAVGRGKAIAGAEFCAPMAAFHAHIDALAATERFIFFPVWIGPRPTRIRRLDGAPKGGRPQKYCYYSQYGASLAANLAEGRARLVSPLIRSCDTVRQTKRELLRALRPALGDELSFAHVSRAYDRAERSNATIRAELKRLFFNRLQPDGEIVVALVGRPYAALAPEMNKGIPQIFAKLGIRTCYQDMLPEGQASGAPRSDVARLSRAFHWHYAGEIIAAAEKCTRISGLYPVLITSFKCSPDSFAIEYFKRILDGAGKPYLILQLDEHDSTVGYETRIEAGIRSFRNHYRMERALAAQPAQASEAVAATHPAAGAPSAAAALPPTGRALSIAPHIERRIDGRTLLFPNWDPITCRFLAANLRREGIDARILVEDEGKIRAAMRRNTGQCIPLNIIVQEFVDYVRAERLDPARALLWMIRSDGACNLTLFPYYIKSLLQAYGGGMEQAGVYAGDLSHLEISPLAGVRAYFAYLAGGMLRRLGCRIRPYEQIAGETDRAIAESTVALEVAFEGRRPLDETLAGVVEHFSAIARRESPRPKVAIFGDLYVRDNEVMNDDLIHTIEAAGGEVVTTPYNEYLKIISGAYFTAWRREGKILTLLEYRSLLIAIELLEKRFAGLLDGYPLPSAAECSASTVEHLDTLHVRIEQEGESYDNILKIFHILRAHPDISLFVQTSPAFCCPSLVTEAMARRIERVTGVPIVTLTYDGTAEKKNELVVPYLAFPRRAGADRARGWHS